MYLGKKAEFTIYTWHFWDVWCKALLKASSVCNFAATYTMECSVSDSNPDAIPYEVATLALHWFWFPEAQFGCAPGVLRTRVGYTGGKKKNPIYENMWVETMSQLQIFQLNAFVCWLFCFPGAITRRRWRSNTIHQRPATARCWRCSGPIMTLPSALN